MATHSSVLAWRIPGMGSHRVRQDCSDLQQQQQKVTVNQMGSRPPVTMTFFSSSLALGSALRLLLDPAAELVVALYKSTFCHIS